jgi:hypothetical protein
MLTYNYAVFPDFNVVPDSGRLHYRVCTNMNVVSHLHGIIVEISAICFVWWSDRKGHMQDGTEQLKIALTE